MPAVWRLRARQCVLREIERDLAESDPCLVALFTSFTLLAQDEKMPRREKIAAGPLRSLSRPRGQAKPHRTGEGWRAALLRSFLYGLLAMTGMVPGMYLRICRP